MRAYRLLVALFIIQAMLVSCVQTVSHGGGGSEVEVIGYVNHSSGEPAPLTQVKLIPKDYDPLVMGPIPDSMTDTSDTQGCYRFKVTPGFYNVQAVQLTELTRILVTGLEVAGDTTSIESATLLEPGAVRFILSDNTKKDGHVTIPGTDIHKTIPGGSKDILLDSVPAVVIPEIQYIEDEKVVFARNDIQVNSSDTAKIINPEWKYQKQINFNTTASGANVNTDIYDFAVIIRLSSSNFDFTQARNLGEDIRFTSLNGKSLSYEIEKWNATVQEAAIWVKIDTIYGNNSTQSILMYWGNPDAEDQSSCYEVFDTTAGFAGVWHLSDQSEDLLFRDATANLYHGNSDGSTRPLTDKGIIGNCCVFDGIDDFITMPNTADSKLNFPENGNYTVSAWVFLDSLDNLSHSIVSKGYEQYFMRFTYFPNGVPSWEFVEFNETDNWQASLTPAQSGQWVFLTGVRQGESQLLYCNGELVDSTTDNWPQELSRNTTNDLSIGKFLEEVIFPTVDGYCYFKGSIDEVRIMSSAQNPEWIRLCYMNQRDDDRLIEFR